MTVLLIYVLLYAFLLFSHAWNIALLLVAHQWRVWMSTCAKRLPSGKKMAEEPVFETLRKGVTSHQVDAPVGHADDNMLGLWTNQLGF